MLLQNSKTIAIKWTCHLNHFIFSRGSMLPTLSRPQSQLVTMYAPEPHVWDTPAPIWSAPPADMSWIMVTAPGYGRRTPAPAPTARPGSVCLSDKYQVSETASQSGWRRQRLHHVKPEKTIPTIKSSNRQHTSNLEIEISDNRFVSETRRNISSPVIHETQVSFENAEGPEGRERRRTKSGTSTSLSEKYSLNTSRSSDPEHDNIGDRDILTVTDLTKYNN